MSNASVHDNFIDPTRLYTTPVYFDGNSGIINAMSYGNVNLVTGKPLLQSPYNNHMVTSPPVAPTITSVTTNTASGTGPVGDRIDVFDRAPCLGRH